MLMYKYSRQHSVLKSVFNTEYTSKQLSIPVQFSSKRKLINQYSAKITQRLESYNRIN